MPDPTPKEVQEQAIKLMEAASTLTLRLSEREESYDLRYIARQLAKCSAYGERVADIMAQLAQLRVGVLLQIDRATNALEAERARIEFTQEVQKLPVGKIPARVAALTQSHAGQLRAWKTTSDVLREVKADVSRRGETVKRLDSDLRLHEKIIEAKLSAGAMSPADALGGDPPDPERPQDIIPDTAGDTDGFEIELD